MWKHEHAAAKALKQFAGRIEFQNRWKSGSGARIGAATFGYPQAAIAIDLHCAGRPPHSAVGKLKPIFDRAIRIGQVRLRISDCDSSYASDDDGQYFRLHS